MEHSVIRDRCDGARDVSEIPYPSRLDDAQRCILQFLRAFEDAQQHIRFQHIDTAQHALAESAGDALADATRLLDVETPPVEHTDVHRALLESITHLQSAQDMFLVEAPWPNFGAAYVASRSKQCSALEILYRCRVDLPLIEPYFRIANDSPVDGALDHESSTNDPAVGILHRNKADTHHEYSLYVPEYYDNTKQWPLIVALHGGYGRGDEYIWTWLRIARSRGYIVLSPKSIADTWSIALPQLDARSIVMMMDKVCAAYSVDRARILLTGLSDGATFGYLLGLQHSERFAALAPIAGVLNPMTDGLLRSQKGIEMPIHSIHGVHDAIFPVQTARSANELLKSLGYQLAYTELPDWGHALTYSINENLVLPWFERTVAQ